MSYSKIRESLKGSIQYLSTQIEPWVKQYKCRNAFDLYTQKFDDADEKARIMGYIHRRDAYISILNMLESEQTSIAAEESEARIKPIPISRKWEIVATAVTRQISEELKNVPLSKSSMLTNIDSYDNFEVKQFLPLYAAKWYNEFVEPLNVVAEDDTRPCDV